MRQQISEDYLGHKFWHCNGEVQAWLPDNPVYDGTITTQADAADFATDARDNASVEALTDGKKVLVKPPNGVVSIEFRFRYNGTAGDQHVLQLFAAAGKDYYDLVDSLTIDQGAQEHTSGAAGTGIDFCDTIVSAGEKWLTATTELSDTSDHIGRYTMNCHGYDRFWFVASTLDTANSGTTLYIDWKQL